MILPTWQCIFLCLGFFAQDAYSLETVDLIGHESRCVDVSISPDATLIASASLDGSLRLWSVRDAKLITILEESEFQANRARFSPDGRWVAGAFGDGHISLWDTRTHKLLQTLEGRSLSIVSLQFSPDGRMLATADEDDTPPGQKAEPANEEDWVRIWDVERGIVLHHLADSEDAGGLEFSHDGKMLAATGFDYTAHIWDTASGKLKYAFNEGGLGSLLKFSRDDHTLAFAGGGSDVQLLDLTPAGNHVVLKTKPLPVCCMEFFPSEKTLLLAGFDRTARVWEIAPPKKIAELPLEGSPNFETVKISADNHIVAALANGDVLLRSGISPHFAEECRKNLKHGQIYCMDVAQGREMLAVGQIDGEVTIVRWKKAGATGR